jgi:DNA-binding transcriptional regulator GbsR (MarR family)
MRTKGHATREGATTMTKRMSAKIEDRLAWRLHVRQHQPELLQLITQIEVFQAYPLEAEK